MFQESSPTHPLLSKLYSSPFPTHPSSPEPDPTHITYTHSPRPIKDLPFLILFTLFVLSTFAFGIFSIFNHNPDSSYAFFYTYDAYTSSCIKPTNLNHSISFLSKLFLEKSNLFEILIWILVITVVLSVPFGFFLLLLLKHYTKFIVYGSLPFFVIVPIFVNVYWFVACSVSSSCSQSFDSVYRILVLSFVFLVIGIVLWIFVANWHRVELTVKIIRVAANALSQNLGLFWVLPALYFGLVVYLVVIVVFLVFAKSNGKIVPREKDGEFYCSWKKDGWVVAYYVLAIFTILWSAAVMVEAQVYVISGTIAQWYFSKNKATLKKSLRSSLRNAFGPSFGTVCFSGLLSFSVRLIRAAIDNAKQDLPGAVNVILRCCVNTFMATFDFLNEFTINLAAITGEAYCTSARMTYELLSRNLLSAVFVETVSTRVLSGISFVFAAIYGIMVCAVLKGAIGIGNDSYFIAVMAWLLLLLVLGFVVQVLDNVIETVYVCYAIDRDTGNVCKQEIHDVYVHLPITRNHISHISRTPLA
ncbi:uncharacterized protein LOC141672460 [Apium graveolens]|uniref:uncharacterized protein LOC141672460 n=1 Tax=Apium graveolens TaxID=4045 RepID=UPI003D7AB197